MEPNPRTGSDARTFPALMDPALTDMVVPKGLRGQTTA